MSIEKIKLGILLTHIVILSLSPSAFLEKAEAGPTAIKSYAIGIGCYTQFPDNVQINDQGELNGHIFSPYLTSNIRVKLSDYFSLHPEISILYPDKGRDRLIQRWSGSIKLNLSTNFYQISPIFGLGQHLTTYTAKSDSQKLKNGNSETEFPMHERMNLSYELIAIGGLAYSPFRNLRIQLATHLHGLFNEKKREFRGIMSISYIGTLFKSPDDSDQMPKASGKL